MTLVRNYKTYTVNTTFLYDDKNDVMLISVFVPQKCGKEEVRTALLEAHEHLEALEDDEGLYENNGRNIESLMSYVCRKHGWDWDSFDPDLEIVFE